MSAPAEQGGARRPFSRQQWIVLLVCVGIFALGQFHRASGSVFTPILMDRFALSAATVGGLVSAMFFASMAAQLPFGMLLDRKGPRLVLTGCIVTVALGTIIFAGVSSFEAAVGSRILIGIGLAAMGAATHIIIARNFTTQDFGYVSGLVVTIGGVGGLLGTYPLAFALERWPWVWVFGFVAGVAVLLAALVLRAVAPHTKKPAPDEAEPPSGGFVMLLRQAEFRKILAMGVVSFAPITTITGLWGGPFLQDVVLLSPERAGAVLFMLFGASIMGGYIFGRLDRWATSRRSIVFIGAACSSLSLILLASLDKPQAFVSIALLLAMVFSQQFYISVGAHMRKSVPDHLLGRGSTLFAMVSVASIPLMQLGFGAILDLAAGLGWSLSAQYRFAFAAMAILILFCGSIYATSKQINNAT